MATISAETVHYQMLTIGLEGSACSEFKPHLISEHFKSAIGAGQQDRRNLIVGHSWN